MAGLDVLAKVVLLACMALVLVDPDWGNLDGKAPVQRALTYPLLAFAVPVWWTLRRSATRYPWLPDLLLTLAGFSDVLGNRLDLYDRITWFDDWMHFANITCVSAALVLLTLDRTASRTAVLERSLALGMTAAIVWELFEYLSFLTRSAELPTAYADTVGDLTLGWLGAVAAALLVHHVWRHHLPAAPHVEARVRPVRGDDGVNSRSSSRPPRTMTQRGLRHLTPRALQVPQRLGHHEPRVIGQLVQHGVVGILGTQRGDVGAVEQRPRPPLAGVAERPRGLPVGGRHRHLDRVLDAVASSGLLDEADRSGDCLRRVLLETERQGEEEEQLGVGRSLDLREERRIDGQRQVALHGREVGDGAVVHPEPAAVAEGVTVGLLDRRAGRRPDVREDATGGGLGGELPQVAVVPGRLGAVVDARGLLRAVPADAEAVTVDGFHAQP